MPCHPETYTRIDDFEEHEDDEDDRVSSVSAGITASGSWFPGVPSPSPLDTNRLAQRMVPRVPIRLVAGGPIAGQANIRSSGAATGGTRAESTIGGGGARFMTREMNAQMRAQGQSNETSSSPTKIDPRSVRFTEIVEQLLNGLIDSGSIYKTQTGWEIAFRPRRIAAATAFQLELFIDTATGRLAYKNADGSVTGY